MTALLDAAEIATRLADGRRSHPTLTKVEVTALRLLAKHARESADPMAVVALDDLARIIDGYMAISLDEFCTIMRETIGGDRHYAEKNYGPFVSSPISYCRYRNPRSQGERLTALAKQKASAFNDAASTPLADEGTR